MSKLKCERIYFRVDSPHAPTRCTRVSTQFFELNDDEGLNVCLTCDETLRQECMKHGPTIAIHRAIATLMAEAADRALQEYEEKCSEVANLPGEFVDIDESEWDQSRWKRKEGVE